MILFQEPLYEFMNFFSVTKAFGFLIKANLLKVQTNPQRIFNLLTMCLQNVQDKQKMTAKAPKNTLY